MATLKRTMDQAMDKDEGYEGGEELPHGDSRHHA
jgi:hypothetical protein